MYVIKQGKLPSRADLIGRRVKCLRSWFHGYEEGEVYIVSPDKRNPPYILLEHSGRVRFNGHDGEWLLLDEEELTIEEFV